ncbi:MAG: UDP-N-acetylglucosamine--N-acetylmuramyl-(pentapeptide) pyrophosphoryl-undecaprenol N-acetylglucosamine transferase [Patescibacteria group bacterium]
MKIAFTGGGTGGHFFPIIAVAEEVNKLVEERKLVNIKLYYLSSEPYDERALFENKIEFVRIHSGKWRRYFSLLNFIDLFRIAFGTIGAFIKLYFIFPDVIFSKGGYLSVPVVLAARVLGIPVFAHESDSLPGRATLLAARSARRVALSYAEAAEAFPPERQGRLLVTGNPIRNILKYPLTEGAREFLNLEPDVPVIFITGGSQGAQALNDVVVDALPELVKRYAVIHQVGKANLEAVRQRSKIVLENSPQANRYKLFDFLNPSAMRMVAGVAMVIISRAGSFIFEIAEWGVPAILVPIPEPISHDQRTNAFTYARSGAAMVIEQGNLLTSVLVSEIDRLATNPKLRETMVAAAKGFAKPEAARVIAVELLNIGLTHEK